MSGPGFSHDLRQRQTQSLVLAPQLRHSLKILQVAALDLRSVIQEELQSNPTLEELPMDDIGLDKTEKTEADDAPVESEGEGAREEMDFSKEFEILGKLDEDWRDHMANAGGSQPFTAEDAEKRQHFMDSLVSVPSLQEHLMRQAEMADLTPTVFDALKHLIGSLNDRGFLTQSLADAALQSGLSLEAMQTAHGVLRGFDPLGIGSQTLEECLLSQLTHHGRESSLAARILRDHFDLLARRRVPELARKLGANPDDIQLAIEEIAKLDPAPGRRFAEDSNRVVQPDVT
ncbi:MAG: RNA polymerase sigma-54 factor, partial [Opitutaceae bacterium]|nr:RNA polymerase sigma-54 factor [Opitutaceae bacterium]